jgi:hypothetical protein
LLKNLSYLSFKFFCRFWIQRMRFFPLWDSKEEFFSVVGYNGDGFPLLWDTKEEVFFLCGIQRRTISGWRKKFFPLYPTTQEFFFRCILHHNRILCSVLYPTSQKLFLHCIPHRRITFFCNKYNPEELRDALQKNIRIISHNATGFLPFYPTIEEIFLRCGIQQKRFFPPVGYNGRGFSSIVGYNERVVFFFVGYNGRGFFPLWDTMEKNDTTKNDILKF